MKKNPNRSGITRLTPGQCSRIAGGDPGMALAGMGIGFQGGPPAVVTVGPPTDVPLGGFDRFIMSTAGGAAGYAMTGFIAGIAEGAALGTALGPAGWVAGAVVGGLAYFAAEAVLQHAANNNPGAYTDGHGLRHAAP